MSEQYTPKRKPGRPRKVANEDLGTLSDDEFMRDTSNDVKMETAEEFDAAASRITENRAVQTKRQRRRRDDSGEMRGMRLHIPSTAKDKNFRYRWINDTPGGRLQGKTLHDDWEIVTQSELAENTKRSRNESYDARLDTDAGEAVSRIVGTNPDGTALRAFFCKKPLDWFEEDQKKAQARIDETEQAMQYAPPSSKEGLSGPNAYLPSGVNKIGREN